MIQDNNNPIHWIAEEDRVIVRKADSAVMGEEIWLGVNDSIGNYEEMQMVSVEE